MIELGFWNFAYRDTTSSRETVVSLHIDQDRLLDILATDEAIKQSRQARARFFLRNSTGEPRHGGDRLPAESDARAK